VTLENGKGIDEARGEVRRGMEVIEFAAGMPTLMSGQANEQVSRGIDTELFHTPLGAVAAITPFNFPSMVPLWTAPIAIAAGNTFILKPSQRTPLSAMKLAELLEKAGSRPGSSTSSTGPRTR
jgi:malonate-semialdehyde dehydrogenase (acetylating) / methylmalonate-semialdehyde dehydrogenase